MTSAAAAAPRYRVGVDLGGTKIECIVLGSSEAIDGVLARHRRPTPADAGQPPAERYRAILAAIDELVRETLKQVEGSPALDSANLSLGIGIPGILNPATGLVINANTTCLIGQALGADLTKLLGRTPAIENDANCFVAAEARQGAGASASEISGVIFGVIMGTGCGGGIYIKDSSGGHVRSGRHGIAGEWGHISIDPRGRQCWCGNRGCVETMISGSGVETGHRLRTGRALNMHEIVSGFRSGDAECTATMQRFFSDFGRALGGLISMLDPDLVVLGGGLSNIPELYTQGMDELRRFAFHPGLETPVLKNKLGDSAGVFGAAWIGA